MPGVTPINLYKNNTDNKGASYGAHENYLMRRSTPFADIVKHLVPFFVSRQVMCGAGRVGIGQDGHGAGFQLTQRADFFEVEVGLETTLKRPIINTRDEPHADAEKYRRLHVIVGDANLAELCHLPQGRHHVPGVGHDRGVLPAARAHRGRAGTRAARGVARRGAAPCHPAGRRPDASPRWTCRASTSNRRRSSWPTVSARTSTSRPRTSWPAGSRCWPTCKSIRCSSSDALDWPAKLRILEGYRDRDGLAWSAAQLQAVDLQYSDVRPEKGLYHRLVARGAMKTLLPPGAAQAAVRNPPEDTRAYFRGECLRRYGPSVAAASWDSVIFDIGRESLVRVPTLEPGRGSRAHVEALLDRCPTAADLVAELLGER